MCLAATDYHLGNIENVAPCSLRPGFIDRIYRFSSFDYSLILMKNREKVDSLITSRSVKMSKCSR